MKENGIHYVVLMEQQLLYFVNSSASIPPVSIIIHSIVSRLYCCFLVATIVDDQRFNRSNQRSVLNHLSCSAITTTLSQCNVTLKGSSCFTSVSKCSTEVGLRCHSKSTCIPGQFMIHVTVVLL